MATPAFDLNFDDETPIEETHGLASPHQSPPAMLSKALTKPVTPPANESWTSSPP